MNLAKKLLAERGVEDSVAYIDSVESTEKIDFSERSDFSIRGSVHLMLGKIIDSKEIDDRLNQLRHL